MSAESYLPWDWDGRLDPKEIREFFSFFSVYRSITLSLTILLCSIHRVEGDMRDIVMVAGTDPYSHKEVQTNLTHPYIRADKPSGALFNEVA